jgi:hypothetical protein
VRGRDKADAIRLGGLRKCPGELTKSSQLIVIAVGAILLGELVLIQPV